MSQIQAIKDATDIVALIGARISLQRSGSNFKGLCPFHSEKSPSFFVSEPMQRFRCFGCSESGDVFEFLQKYEGMSFYESLELLAEQAGIKLETTTRSHDDEEREQLLQVLSLAKEYYHFLLVEHKAGALARSYLQDRGITAETRELFQLGAAPASWDGLIKYLHHKKKFPLDLLEAAGLVIKTNGGRYYDRFRNRLIFPLKNHRGQVVGFSGRLLSGEAKEAKYINSPETKLYHKSEMLFGYHELYQQIRKAKRVIVVEGEFDVLSSVQAHVDEVVAIKGSALTEEHAKLLKRSAEQVVLALDTDAAGVTATKRAVSVLQKHAVELRVIRIPSGKDPDDLARSDPKQWREVAKQSVTAYEFLISAALQANDITKPEGKRRVMQALSPVLAELEHAVELEYYIKDLADSLNVSSDSVRQDINRAKKTQALGGSKDTAPPEQAAAVSKKALSKRALLERNMLFVLLKSEPEDLMQRAGDLADTQLEYPGFSHVLTALQPFEGKKSVVLRSVLHGLPNDVQQLVFTVYSDPEMMEIFDAVDLAVEWKRLLGQFRGLVVAEQKQTIAAELAQLDEQLEKSPQDEARQQELLQELVRLNVSKK